MADRLLFQSFNNADLNPDCGTECRDIGMLGGLQPHVDNQSGDILVVLHQMGSHGPAKYKSYPKLFEVFQPACGSNQLSQCSKTAITNAYDNTILYTDYFLS